MIKFTSDSGCVGYAMFMPAPHNTVVGIVQCQNCGLSFPVTCDHQNWPDCTDEHIDAINAFFNDPANHDETCKPIVRRRGRSPRRRTPRLHR